MSEQNNLSPDQRQAIDQIGKKMEAIKIVTLGKKSSMEVEVTIRMKVKFEEYDAEPEVNFQGQLCIDYDTTELVRQFESKIEDYYYENK